MKNHRLCRWVTFWGGKPRTYAVPAEGRNCIRTAVEGRWAGGRRVPVQETSRPRCCHQRVAQFLSFPEQPAVFRRKSGCCPLEMGHDTAGQLRVSTAPAFLPGLIQGQQRGGTGLAAGEPGQPGHGPVVKTQPQSRMRLPQQCAGRVMLPGASCQGVRARWCSSSCCQYSPSIPASSQRLRQLSSRRGSPAAGEGGGYAAGGCGYSGCPHCWRLPARGCRSSAAAPFRACLSVRSRGAQQMPFHVLGPHATAVPASRYRAESGASGLRSHRSGDVPAGWLKRRMPAGLAPAGHSAPAGPLLPYPGPPVVPAGAHPPSGCGRGCASPGRARPRRRHLRRIPVAADGPLSPHAAASHAGGASRAMMQSGLSNPRRRKRPATRYIAISHLQAVTKALHIQAQAGQPGRERLQFGDGDHAAGHSFSWGILSSFRVSVM